MGYSAETNDINFSSGTTAFYGFFGFLINGPQMELVYQSQMFECRLAVSKMLSIVEAKVFGSKCCQ
jgi:hypothetical protein